MATMRSALRRPLWQPINSTPFTFVRPRFHQPIRLTQEFHSTSRQNAPRFSYQRYDQTKGIFLRWSQSRYFYHQVAGISGLCGGFYIYNLEEVPVSHRKRFNIISPAYEESTSLELYKQVMSEYHSKILPPHHPQVRLVKSVLDRLLPHSGLENTQDWEVHVIQDDQKNAFVIPGGKVFVFSGILDVCQGEDGLAAVLGHEIAHNVAHHAAERLSSSAILLSVAVVLPALLGLSVDFGITRMAVDLAFLRPGGRKQESEADYIGLMMMSEACYDPRAAMGLWSRMEKLEQAQGTVNPQFLSTHPSSHNRLEQIQTWLPQAEKKLEEGECSGIQGYVQDFKNTFDRGRW